LALIDWRVFNIFLVLLDRSQCGWIFESLNTYILRSRIVGFIIEPWILSLLREIRDIFYNTVSSVIKKYSTIRNQSMWIDIAWFVPNRSRNFGTIRSKDSLYAQFVFKHTFPVWSLPEKLRSVRAPCASSTLCSSLANCTYGYIACFMLLLLYSVCSTYLLTKWRK